MVGRLAHRRKHNLRVASLSFYRTKVPQKKAGTAMDTADLVDVRTAEEIWQQIDDAAFERVSVGRHD